jgi:transcriptional regulator with XRE-family HTH domain
VNTILAKRRQLISRLHNKEARDAVVEQEILAGLPFQIRALRRDRGWSQHQLAERLGMTQEGVSRLENPNYGRFSLSTLTRLASAFDVALVVRFQPFSALVDWVTDPHRDTLSVPDFDHDRGLLDIERSASETSSGRAVLIRHIDHQTLNYRKNYLGVRSTGAGGRMFETDIANRPALQLTGATSPSTFAERQVGQRMYQL